jgi:hypothetical protein
VKAKRVRSRVRPAWRVVRVVTPGGEGEATGLVVVKPGDVLYWRSCRLRNAEMKDDSHRESLAGVSEVCQED